LPLKLFKIALETNDYDNLSLLRLLVLGITSYERKKRYFLSNKILSQRSGVHQKETQINVLVSLNKLPEEL